MCFPRVPVIVIVILRYSSREGLLKYINVGDKSTMVARLPQQVFLLLVLVTGTTMGIGMYGMELPKSTKSSHPTSIRQDETSGNNPSKKIPHKTISRFDEASNTRIPIPKSDSTNVRTESLENRKFSNWNQEMHHKYMESKIRAKELKNNYPRDESASPLPSPLTDRVELQSISRRDGFVRLQRKETWETSSSSAFYHSLEDPPSLRSRRTSGSFLPSTPTSHTLSLSSSSMTSSFSSNDMPLTSPSSRSLISEVSFSSADDYPETTLSSLSTSTNSMPLDGIVELDDKFSTSADQNEEEKLSISEIQDLQLKRASNEFTKTTQPSSGTKTNSLPHYENVEFNDNFSTIADQSDDKKIESREIDSSEFDRFPNEFSETTQPSSSTSVDNIPVGRISELAGTISKGVDKIEDKIMEHNEIEVSKFEVVSNELSKSTPQPSISTSINSIPVSPISELDKKISKGPKRVEDEIMDNSEIEVSELATLPNKLGTYGTSKQILTTELPKKALSTVHKDIIKSSMWPLAGNENEIRHFDWLMGNRATLSAITMPKTTGFGFSKRYTRDSPEINICESFEIGDPVKKEFYSPNYPENYPPRAKCVLVLEAEMGELLKLDFRETFELESRTPDGDCRFDWLEVRDGQYGFSPKIGTYCDKTFPPEIISQSRYLWLKFVSDDTIEYQGFKAVWSTVPRPNTDAIPVEQEPCIYYEDIRADFELKSDMIKEAKKASEKNRVALDCLWVLRANESMKMQLTFDSFKLEKPNDCSANFLDIFDGETDEPSRVKKFCGSIAEALSTKTNRMYVRLYLEPKAINSSFGALITAVRDKDANQANCKPNEFDCQDATCIALSLRCNSRKNCRFQGDEAQLECGTGSEKQDRSRIVIILVIFSLIMFGMCTAFVFNCVRKLRRDHRIIREHIRQSREDRLDEIGRRATPCPLSVSRTDLRDGGSESPAGEEVDSSKELIPAATLTTREYTKELTLKMKYGTKEITDIHQSNNVSNATQERLQESSEEPDMCDSSCQTRESLFAPIIPDAILSSPAFSTFGYETIAAPDNGLSHKGTPTSEQSYRHHRHGHHPPSLKQTSQRSQDSQRKNSQVSGYPISERCSQEGSAQICPKHNPIPAPPGWSLHDPPYPQIVPEPSGCPEGVDNSSYRRYHSPKPDHDSSIGPSIYQQQHQYQYPPPVFTRQNTVGSGERYGSYIYGSGRASSNTASSNATTTSATSTTTPSTSNTTGSGSPHSATPNHTKTDPRYRAEAVIEVDQKRPFSIESTKSAPDVIATH